MTPPIGKLDEGCTGAIALPGATASGNLLHGQNWDWRTQCAESTVVLRIQPEAGAPSILTMVEGGILARCGFNSAGIAITGNFLHCQDDFGRTGVPLPFARRWILEGKTLFQAMDRLVKSPRSFSNNIMLSDGRGEAVDFETTPTAVFWVEPEDGLLVHANHFVAPGALARLSDLGLGISPDSLYRHRRTRAFLSARRGMLTPAHFAEAFADSYGSPQAVSRMPDDALGGSDVSTVATIIMDVTAQKMWIAPTPYKSQTFWEYDFTHSEPIRRAAL